MNRDGSRTGVARHRCRWLPLLGLLAACGETSAPRPVDAGGGADLGAHDAGPDLGATDAADDQGPRDTAVADLGASDAGTSDASAPSLLDLVDADLWQQMFPERNALYDHAAFVAAAATFPAFASTGTIDERKRELAAFLANVAHETTGGWDTAPGGRFAWGLYFTQEVGCESGACTGYCAASATYPCAAGKTYHGRGPIQLSWNYNYGQAGDALGLDLLGMPERVIADGVTAFRTALWFWMTPQAPKPSCHAVMTGAYVPTATETAANRLPGFGLTIAIINGGIECGYARSPSVTDRLGFYDRFTTMLGVTPGDHLDCDAIVPY